MRSAILILGVLLATGASIGLRQGHESGWGGLSEAEWLAQRARGKLQRGGSEDGREAVKLFRRALEKDPASASRWCDLGESFLESGDEDKARYCLRQA